MPKGQNLAAPKADDVRCTFVRPDGSRCNSYRMKASGDEQLCANHAGVLQEAKEESTAIQSAAARMAEADAANLRRDRARIEERQKDILAAPERTEEMVRLRQVWVREDLGPNHFPDRTRGWLQDAQGFYFRWKRESLDVIEQRDRMMPDTVDVVAAERRDSQIRERDRQARDAWKLRYPRWAAAGYWWGDTYWGGSIPPCPGHSATPPPQDEINPRQVKSGSREPMSLADLSLFGYEAGPHLG